jgi:hypothetical protein
MVLLDMVSLGMTPAGLNTRFRNRPPIDLEKNVIELRKLGSLRWLQAIHWPNLYPDLRLTMPLRRDNSSILPGAIDYSGRSAAVRVSATLSGRPAPVLGQPNLDR